MELASGMTGSRHSKTILPRFWVSSVFLIFQLGDSVLNSFSLSGNLLYHVVGRGGSMSKDHFIPLFPEPG